MASTPQPPRGSRWRPGQSAAAPPPHPPTGPAWRRLEAGVVPLPPRVKAGRLVGVLTLVLATATLLVWLLLWLQPPGPACLVLAGAGYEGNLTLPANPQGREAMGRLANLAGTSSPLSRLFRRSGRLRLAHGPVEVRRGGDWARGLDDAPEKTAVVFLALHGGADGRGAYLLPEDSTGDESDRLRLESVLERLGELPADRNKLLLLDATALRADWTLGLLHNDFARALEALEEKIIAIPNLVVLSASAADQRSWPTADLRLSLFARHLLEGLVGRGDAGPNGRVNAWELFRYVAARVEADARRLHGVTQTPVLLPRHGGEERARAIPLTFELDGSAVQGDPVTDPLPEVEAAWADYDAFRPRAAAAVACVPRDWALWQAWLLRFEQLRLAGSPRAGMARDRAVESAQRVRQGLELELTTASLTLQMPAVQGETQLEVPDPYAPMEQLWQASPIDRQATWARLQQADTGGLLRRNVLVALIRRAAENPARNLDRAAELARLLDDPLRAARPAEAQFLVLLARDLPVRPIPEALNLALGDALRLRLVAEEAALAVTGNGYAYAERIRPWVAGTIAAADLDRQRGEDLLFATGPGEWQKARGLLKKAAAQYRQARDDAVGLREALAACDRGAFELPYHAGWLAAGGDDDLVNRAVALFGEVRRLEKMTQDALARRDRGRMAEIRRQGQLAREGLDLLQVRLDAFARTCESTRSSPLRDGGVVLRVPWLEAGVRDRLLRKLSRLARQARSEGETILADSPGQLDDLARRRAIREGRLALAALGANWFDQPGNGRVPYADVEPFVRRPNLEGAWSKVLRWAGDQIGERFRLYPGRIDALVQEARQQRQVNAPLREADRLSRRLTASQWQRMPADAPVVARQAEVEELLVWQAGRSFTDHWYGDDPRGVPYYRITGLAYLRDARRLDPFGRSDAPGGEAVRKQLEAPDGLALHAGPPPGLIAGDRLRISAGLSAAPGSTVNGYPVIWAEPGPQLTFAPPGSPGRGVLSLEAPLAESFAVTLTCPALEQAEQSPPVDASAEQSECVWRAYYRGQKPSVTTPVNLYPVAESTRVDYPPPPRAAVAVRASDELFARYGRAVGGLAIVLDCSGSEGPVGSAPETARTRYRQAVRALRTVLAHVPRGTRLSLWTFGQAVPPRNTVEKAEETIQRLRDPEVWNGGEAAVEALVAQVSALEPWNQSPIARAVLQAREDVLKDEGFRAIIVLSDGDDNRFAADAEANPKKESISEVLTRRFAGTDIALHFVGFPGADGQPEADLIRNFGFVTAGLPRGTLSTVANLQPLLEAMRQTMPLGLRYRLTGDSPTSPPPQPVEVSREYENDRWLVVPASRDGYRLTVPLLDFDRRLRLGDGDCLLLDLDKGAPGWRRLLWSRQPPFRLRPHREARSWRAAVLQDQLLGARALQMLLCVEREPPPGAEMGQVSPGSVWLEVSPAGVKATPAVRWGEVFGYPAPAWGVDVPGWPVTDQGPPAPNVRLWWGEPSVQSSLVLELADLPGKKQVGKESFEVEPAAYEEHWVQVRPGRREKRWCLVLRARAGKPVWSRLEGAAAPAGQEHRHFLAAGRYVGLYWFADAASAEEVRRKVEAVVTGVRFVGVPAFQQEAADRGDSAAFTDLDTPAALPPRPRPVWPSP